LSPALALNFFRICQEAFTNALKHADASTVIIKFSSNTEFILQFSIKDNGKGFNWVEGQKNGHYGLINMRARAEEMGAKLEIFSKELEGTEVVLSYK
ncbi:MAG: sensor histidine kinase, partial [Bacteroidia bacterium]